LLPYCNRSLSLDVRVADAVQRLSLGEKIGNTMASASNGWSEHRINPIATFEKQLLNMIENLV
jgi:hypothetical protein